MPKKRTALKRSKTHQQRLAEIVTRKGSGRAVAGELQCSQQSVSAWALGLTLPRPPMQKKMRQLYRIPTPWVPLQS